MHIFIVKPKRFQRKRNDDEMEQNNVETPLEQAHDMETLSVCENYYRNTFLSLVTGVAFQHVYWLKSSLLIGLEPGVTPSLEWS